MTATGISEASKLMMMKFLELVLVCHLSPCAPPACYCHAQSGKIFLMRGSHGRNS